MRRLAACGEMDLVAAWRASMHESNTTLDAQAAVLGCTKQTVDELIGNGRITILWRLAQLASHPATRECVRAFVGKVYGFTDDRLPGREALRAELLETVTAAVDAALARRRCVSRL